MNYSAYLSLFRSCSFLQIYGNLKGLKNLALYFQGFYFKGLGVNVDINIETKIPQALHRKAADDHLCHSSCLNSISFTFRTMYV